MQKALVHAVSPHINRCVLTYLDRTPIDVDKARAQHRTYCEFLQQHGVEVVELTGNLELPDSVFIEDTAVIFDEVAVMAQMGLDSRKPEVAAVEKYLRKDRPVVKIEPPAVLEGGDVVQIGNQVFVGHSKRTNDAGIAALQNLLKPYDYEVITVNVSNALHLKTACTAVSNRTLLVNPAWVDIRHFVDFNVITVAEEEPWAANALRVGDTVCLHKGFPQTIQIMRELDFRVAPLDISEFIKAEAGLTCLSLLYEQ